MKRLDIRNTFVAKEGKAMGCSYKDIRNEWQSKAATGLTKAEFTSLTNAFGSTYEHIHGVSLQKRLANLGKEGSLELL